MKSLPQKPLALLVSLAIAGVASFPEAAHAGLFSKIKKGVSGAAKTVASGTKSAAGTVASGTTKAANTVAKGTTRTANTVAKGATSATNTAVKGTTVAAGAVAGAVAGTAAGAVHGAKDALDDGDKVVHGIGETVIDSGTVIGKEVKKGGDTVTHELVQGGKVVGHVTVQGGKVIAHDVVEGGKVVSSEVEKGAKLIVRGGKIVGREVMVNGQIIGEEVIENGKIVGHKLSDAAVKSGEYIIKAGQIILNGLNQGVCMATVTALRSGTKINLPAVPGLPGLPDFGSVFSTLSNKTAAQRKAVAGSAKGSLMTGLSNTLVRNDYILPELKRITGVATSKSAAIKELFTASNFCSLSGADVDKKLSELGLAPTLAKKNAGLFDDGFFIREAHAAPGDHFFMAYNLSGSAAVGVGATFSLSFVTDYKGKNGGFVALGPQVVTNAAAGAGVGVSFFPAVQMDDFEGWGWGVAVSGGPPTKIVSGSVDVSLNDKFNEFQGFGVGVGVGLGVIPGDVGVAATYTWRMR